MGAARNVLGKRELNTRDFHSYLKKVLSGESPTFQSEFLLPRDKAMETMAVQLRRLEGISQKQFLIQSGFDIHEIMGKQREILLLEGLLVEDEQGVRLTRKGKYVADGVIETLMKG